MSDFIKIKCIDNEYGFLEECILNKKHIVYTYKVSRIGFYSDDSISNVNKSIPDCKIELCNEDGEEYYSVDKYLDAISNKTEEFNGFYPTEKGGRKKYAIDGVRVYANIIDMKERFDIPNITLEEFYKLLNE